MKSELVAQLNKRFEEFVPVKDGVECCMARDLQQLLEYTQWRNFSLVIDKAKTSCQKSKQNVSDHFADVSKTIPMPNGANKEITDIMLSRYACYLIAQNGDPRKEQIAFARLRSKGDQALFGGYTTLEMKKKLNVPDKRPIADFLPTITIKAKDLATEITSFNSKKRY